MERKVLIVVIDSFSRISLQEAIDGDLAKFADWSVVSVNTSVGMTVAPDLRILTTITAAIIIERPK